ncbi:hypothetical protein CLV31_11459 [Algoriphagus aquaeductus]|uniref:Uncharacterized protein n=1 Tax=Algoriphagus aquaeductus TaxID=475299 RepID=A0A326RQA7_9BACT|nr:hypothetical protein CLV31_11459 [Algoriphagus aquaeductus]
MEMGCLSIVVKRVFGSDLVDFQISKESVILPDEFLSKWWVKRN